MDILLLGRLTVPEVTIKPLLQVKEPLSIVEGRVTVPVKIGLLTLA